MSNHIYQLAEFAGSSTTSLEEAIRNAIARAARDLPNLRWFNVVETRGHIQEGKVAHWQVVVKVGATLVDDKPSP